MRNACRSFGKVRAYAVLAKEHLLLLGEQLKLDELARLVLMRCSGEFWNHRHKVCDVRVETILLHSLCARSISLRDVLCSGCCETAAEWFRRSGYLRLFLRYVDLFVFLDFVSVVAMLAKERFGVVSKAVSLLIVAEIVRLMSRAVREVERIGVRNVVVNWHQTIDNNEKQLVLKQLERVQDVSCQIKMTEARANHQASIRLARAIDIF